MNIFKTLSNSFYSILKGKGPKGATWTKGPDGKRIYSTNGKPELATTQAAKPVSETPTKATPEQPLLPHHFIKAWANKNKYDSENLKGGVSCHSLTTTNSIKAHQLDDSLKSTLEGKGFHKSGEVEINPETKQITTHYEHADGSKVISTVSSNHATGTGHIFSITPPRIEKPKEAEVKPTFSEILKPAEAPKADNTYSEEHLKSYLQGLRDLNDKYVESNGGSDSFKHVYTVQQGSKYAKVVSHSVNGKNGSVHSFIAKKDIINKGKTFPAGSILYPASFAAPALNHARGHISIPVTNKNMGSHGPF